MGKTFDEWWEEHEYGIAWSIDFYGSYKELEVVARMIWEASRQNMTTRDI